MTGGRSCAYGCMGGRFDVSLKNRGKLPPILHPSVMSTFKENPPEGSVITERMIELWCKYFETANDDTQRPGVIGSLVQISEGRSHGTPIANLLDAPSLREDFKPLRAAFFAALGFSEPAYSNVEDPSFLTEAAE